MASRSADTTCEPLDAVLRRFVQLRNILAHQSRTSLADPDAKRNVDLGLIALGTTRSGARSTLPGVFDALDVQIERQAVLELCAAFEHLFRSRLSTALGEAKRVLDQAEPAPGARIKMAKLLRDSASFDSLESVFVLLESGANERSGRLKALRRARNDIAHGRNLDARPTVSVEAAHALLIELATEYL